MNMRERASPYLTPTLTLAAVLAILTIFAHWTVQWAFVAGLMLTRL